MAATEPQSDISEIECTTQLGSLDIVCGANELTGAIMHLPNGSSWRLTKPLIRVKYQQAQPPFEARQVFECSRIFKPQELRTGEETAIVKVKHQVQGTAEALAFLEDWRRQTQDGLQTARGDLKELLERELENTNKIISMATLPVSLPNEHTVDEIKTLDRFRSTGCVHTPQLINVICINSLSGIYQESMAGGYTKFIFMTKLPGKRLEWDTFWGKTKEERDEIRLAFKVALMGVWAQGIDPRDRAMRNILWDEVGGQCYIVDFEDYSYIANFDPQDLSERWERLNSYKSWRIDEGQGPER
ncbi:hypothetical protein E8E13_004785 [Curvularia kusanoi]|uniref:Uncharacterized protein n=1 Tax=Curvularia kusanoi TaxID=90978 RepID=A0A9P4TCX0_CURKU|nr:hypothetical protein E8E13_004785 [Curvularia kusanoi]